MAGKVSEFDPDKAEFEFLDKPKNANKRVEEFKLDDISSVDMSKEAQTQEAVPVATPPKEVMPPESQEDIEPPEPKKEKKAPQSLFSSSVSTPLELATALIDRYALEWLQWDPEVLWKTIREDFATQISATSKEKINAARLVQVSDSFWRSWEVFEKVVVAFNGNTPQFDRVQDISVGEMAFAMRQAANMRKEPFEEEVLYYIARRAKSEGFIWLPPHIDVAQEKLDELNPPEISKEKAEVRQRWEALGGMNLASIEFPEDVFGVHLAKLAAIEEYIGKMTAPELEAA